MVQRQLCEHQKVKHFQQYFCRVVKKIPSLARNSVDSLRMQIIFLKSLAGTINSIIFK